MVSAFPESYKDPLYAQLDANTETKFGLPPGMLSSVRTAGEKTNNSQKSDANTATDAQTVYQITKPTRKAILDKYGIDVTLSPENASLGAGMLLRDSLKRSQGDPETAIREYHGGTDPKNWGPINDAYWKRVDAGMQKSKVAAISSDFSQWMKDNPAQAPLPTSATAPASDNSKLDDLSAQFGAWAKGNPASGSLVNQIPDMPQGQPKAAPDPSLGQQIVGAGEAGLNAITGATGGALGMVGGTAAGIAQSVADGTYGTPEGVRNTERLAGEGAQALTYAPRTQAGQQQAAAVGDALAAVAPVLPLAGELGALGAAARPAATAAGDVVAAGASKAAAAVPALPEAVTGMFRRSTDTAPPGGPTASGGGASAGAAATDVVNQRRATAENLPVPMKLTKGQETRNPEQIRFEQETAKQPAGEAIRENGADQNAILLKNFDNLVDQTGAEMTSKRGVGEVVDKALRNEMARDKTAIRTAYAEARSAGEMEQPVTLGGLIDHLNESAPDIDTSKVLVTARKRALKSGAAIEDGNGDLIARPVTLETAEKLRQAIGQATDYEAPNIRQSAIMKQAIDDATADAGGSAYRSARRTRENFAKKYEDRAVVSKLVNNKKGSADRQVALEDVFDHSILKGSLDDVRALRSTLTKTQGEEGLQAWKELQGQTARHLAEQATKSVNNDIRGNTIVSASGLDKAVRALDEDGKLDFIFTKRGAQTIRDLNELAKLVHTFPPGSVNWSNTAATIIGAIGEAGAAAALTGLPIPVISIIRAATKQIKDRALAKRINDSLNGGQQKTNF